MQSKHIAPSSRVAVTNTIGAVVNLATCFAAVVDHSRAALIMLNVLAEMALIGCSVWSWYVYFRAYLEFRINELKTAPVV